MGQVFRSSEKIGALTFDGAVTITLAPSILTIGGQQYKTNTLSAAIPGSMVAHELWFLYVVLSSNVPTLVHSKNYKSVGPAGAVAWKLVGAYITGVNFNAGDAPIFSAFVPVNQGFTIETGINAGSAVNTNSLVRSSLPLDNFDSSFGIARIGRGSFVPATGNWTISNPRIVNPFPNAKFSWTFGVFWQTTQTNFTNTFLIAVRKNFSAEVNTISRNHSGSTSSGGVLRYLTLDMSGSVVATTGDSFEFLGQQDLVNGTPTAVTHALVSLRVPTPLEDL